MSRCSAITCDVCGKRATERISDWFEIDAGAEGFFAVPQMDRPAGIGRLSKDICGSRCLCVALERWVNRHLRQARDTPPPPEETEPPEWSVPLPHAQVAPPLLLEGPQQMVVRPSKNALIEGAAPEEKKRRGMFRKGGYR